MAAATAAIGMDEGQLYPRLTLGARLGPKADDAADSLDLECNFFGFGPAVENVFYQGRIAG